MASAADEDLVASKTEGFKVGEKKTVEEYAKLGRLLIFSHCSMHTGQQIYEFPESPLSPMLFYP